MNIDLNKVVDGLNINVNQEIREKLGKISTFINNNFYNFFAIIFMLFIVIFFFQFWWVAALGFGGLYYLVKSEKIDLKELLKKIGITR